MENKVSREDLVKALNNINEPLNLDIMKGKAAMVGEIRTWGGKKFKKQGNGKWVEVSDRGMSKEEHTNEVNRLASKKGEEMGYAYHSKKSAGLSYKEYDDTDFEEKEERQTYKKGDKIEINGYKIKWSKKDELWYVYKGKKQVNVFQKKENARKFAEQASKLSDKEYTDEEIAGKERVEKSLQDHFSIINAPLNLNKEEEIKKSDVYYALDNNYNSQSPIGKFKKKGSELKAMASTKKAKYETKKVIIEASKEETMSKLKEAGVECIEGEYGCKFNYNYETTPQSTRDLIHKYNNLSYECDGINKDIKALNVIIKHCEDNKMYDVTARQLISLDDE